MTINEYLKGLPDMKSKNGQPMRELMADAVSIWSNDSCKGYCILAMQQAGFNREQIEKVLTELRWAFDEKTVTEAERAYIEF